MKVIKTNQVPKKELVHQLFNGPVTYQGLVTRGMSKDFNIIVIGFGKGIRNKFHTHTNDQELIVTSGKGIVATEAEQQVVEVGDVIHIPAGEKHWHGATKDSDFSHIAIEPVDTKFTQLED